jgi:hypothetical protein
MFSICVLLLGQIRVAEVQFSIEPGEEKSFYYKFAEGDTIIFNAYVIRGNDISEVKVIKYPNTVFYTSYAVKKVENEVIYNPQRAIYQISFKNTSMLNPKVYKFVIYRKPTKPEFNDFDVSVQMITTYDTIYVEDIESTLVKVDTTWEEIVNTTLNVGSQMGGGDTKAYVKVDLPSNTSTWVYWIGVGQEAAEALKELSKSISGVLGMLDPGSALVAYGLGLITDLSLSLKSKDDINYYIYYGNNIIKQGTRVVADYGKMTYPTEGTVYIMLDNSYSVITNKLVNVRVVAIRTLPKYEKRKVRKVKEIRERSYPKLD